MTNNKSWGKKQQVALLYCNSCIKYSYRNRKKGRRKIYTSSILRYFKKDLHLWEQKQLYFKNLLQCTPDNVSWKTVSGIKNFLPQCKISCLSLDWGSSGAVVNVTVSSLVLCWPQLYFHNRQSNHRDLTDIWVLLTATFTFSLFGLFVFEQKHICQFSCMSQKAGDLC